MFILEMLQISVWWWTQREKNPVGVWNEVWPEYEWQVALHYLNLPHAATSPHVCPSALLWRMEGQIIVCTSIPLSLQKLLFAASLAPFVWNEQAQGILDTYYKQKRGSGKQHAAIFIHKGIRWIVSKLKAPSWLGDVIWSHHSFCFLLLPAALEEKGSCCYYSTPSGLLLHLPRGWAAEEGSSSVLHVAP